jgi:hypothetical protein
MTVGEKRDLRPTATLLGAVRRAGFPEDTIRALQLTLGGLVDLRRDGNVLAGYGITRDRLVDRMGGSP